MITRTAFRALVRSRTSRPPRAPLVLVVATVVFALASCVQSGTPPLPAEPGVLEPGVVQGSARTADGRPLAGARIDVVNVADRYSANIVASTNAAGAYRVHVPLGSWAAYGSLPVAVDGVQTCLPLEPTDGGSGFWHADGAVRDFTLRIHGPRTFSDGSHGFWGGTIEFASRFPRDPFRPEPIHATLRVVLEPLGVLLDGSVGDALVLEGTVDLADGFSIQDIPLGRYRVGAYVLAEGGAAVPLDLQAYVGDRLTNDGVIAFDEPTSLGCGAIAKRSTVVLSPAN